MARGPSLEDSPTPGSASVGNQRINCFSFGFGSMHTTVTQAGSVAAPSFALINFYNSRNLNSHQGVLGFWGFGVLGLGFRV